MSITGQERMFQVDLGTCMVVESVEVVADMSRYADQVFEAHRHSADVEEQIDAHLESQFPEVHDAVRRYIVDEVMEGRS